MGKEINSKVLKSYLDDGWELNWGDGALDEPHIKILRKHTRIVVVNNDTTVKSEETTDYVVLSSERPVEFLDVKYYSS